MSLGYGKWKQFLKVGFFDGKFGIMFQKLIRSMEQEKNLST